MAFIFLQLEYTIAQQQTEVRGLKDKLSSHDSAAKKAIAALQSEMKLRVDQVCHFYFIPYCLFKSIVALI